MHSSRKWQFETKIRGKNTVSGEKLHDFEKISPKSAVGPGGRVAFTAITLPMCMSLEEPTWVDYWRKLSKNVYCKTPKILDTGKIAVIILT